MDSFQRGSLRGMSTLRKQEEERKAKDEPKSEKLQHLEAYLQRYSTGGVDAGAKGNASGLKKKRRKKKRTTGNLTIVDASSDMGIPSVHEDEAILDTEAPVVVNAEELEREEQIRSKQKVIKANQRWQSVSTVARRRTQPHIEEKKQRSPSLSEGEVEEQPRQRYDSDSDNDSDMDVRRRTGRQRYDSDSDDEVGPSGKPASSGRAHSDDTDDSDSDLDVRRRPRRPSSDDDDDDDDGNANGGLKAGAVKMSDGTSTGLISSKALAEELERNRLQKLKKFEDMDPKLSGKAAKTVYRDKNTGAKLSQDELAQREREEEQQKLREKPMWSSGLAQQRKRKEMHTEMFQDEQTRGTLRDASLKERHRFGDPMAHLVRSKSNKNSDGVADDAEDEDDAYYKQRFGVSLSDLQNSGYVIPAGTPSHSWTKRGVRCPENRFGIPPGRYWDGVDRSNGFEKDYFKEINRKRHREQLAFMWSQEDI